MLGGNGLFRLSFSVEDDEDGVRLGDWPASLELELGDDVPSLASLFFLEDLFPLRESTLWLKRFIFEDNSLISLNWGDRRRPTQYYRGQLTTATRRPGVHTRVFE